MRVEKKKYDNVDSDKVDYCSNVNDKNNSSNDKSNSSNVNDKNNSYFLPSPSDLKSLVPCSDLQFQLLEFSFEQERTFFSFFVTKGIGLKKKTHFRLNSWVFQQIC